ncbi:ABC transporter permease [Ruegeria sp. 2012CJ41-6]|uniref:ABC transporter permease n=1 Tax=Ruegeria spongiae TaxID=2942209 RepID=A0ABT0Q2V6_9RHOB|nr:ABC transporter permease [Ruegeria spongiae]MCL6284166.1 ABC transporter permease [Ruegeria spongiae]
MFDHSLSGRERVFVAAAWVFSGLVIVFLVLPIVAIIPLSFTSDSLLSYPMPDWSLRWYRELMDSPAWTRALKNSLIVAVGSTCLATVLGTLAAIGLNRRSCPWPILITAFLTTPMIVPVIITAISSYFFYSRLGLTNSFAGMILAHTILGAPFVVITVTATLKGFDQNQIKAASSLGARPIYAFRTVTLPQILPGVVSGAVFAFVTSFDEVIVALFVAGSQQITLPRQMFSGVRDNLDPTIAAVATLMVLVTFGALGIAGLAVARRRRKFKP